MILSDAHMLPIYTRAKLAYDYKAMQLALIIELALLQFTREANYSNETLDNYNIC